MGAVIAFSRPEPAPAKPPEPEKPADTTVSFTAEGGKKIIAFYLDQFDEITRYLFDDDSPVSEKKALISRWRKHKDLEQLELLETHREN